PDYIFEKTTKITPDFLKSQGITNLLLDVDNTLTTHDNPQPSPGIEDWLDEMRANGISMMIISNNNKDRVAPFAARHGLPFTSMACKPLPFGYKKGMKMLGANRRNTAMIGDQIFTDVMGANMSGIKCFMVLAILAEDSAGFKFKRKIEKGFVDKYLKQQVGPL
ncbi:MAG: YqeG family HAD IIIA-type phosphatase, partial [Oscillospiraceae bacterium]|nr:YqeG family HAD IIIA-type phosphatase [Oscillospiraceae bacterium]